MDAGRSGATKRVAGLQFLLTYRVGQSDSGTKQLIAKRKPKGAPLKMEFQFRGKEVTEIVYVLTNEAMPGLVKMVALRVIWQRDLPGRASASPSGDLTFT
jgi:hypothetical protein